MLIFSPHCSKADIKIVTRISYTLLTCRVSRWRHDEKIDVSRTGYSRTPPPALPPAEHLHQHHPNTPRSRAERLRASIPLGPTKGVRLWASTSATGTSAKGVAPTVA